MPKNQQNLVVRPPVVVVMGHIDHGKSTLLDYIRKTEVVKGEAGGITQHIGAYQAEHVAKDGRKHLITFIDTPGHEAFCGIRERGAQAADIAILVVSAEDGVKPQTVEAYKDIKESKIPFVVAISKTDKPNANIDKAKTSLGESEIYVEGWGGDIPCVAISAATGEGVPELLEMLMLVAEIADLKADTSKLAEGVIIEAELDKRKGIAATVLVKDGVLKIGSFVVSGSTFAPVRFIEDWNGGKIESALPSSPARIIGWNSMPVCGDTFTTLTTKKEAESVSGKKASEEQLEKQRRPNVEAAKIAADKIKPGEAVAPTEVVFPIIIKADVAGSLDGVRSELSKLKNEKVRLKIVAEGVGEVNENDIKLVLGDPSITILGFNSEPDNKAKAMIERSPTPVSLHTFKVIYELTEYVRGALAAKVPKEYVEELTGKVKILAVFSKEKDKQVIGGKVQSGTIESGSTVRIIRRGEEIGTGKIRELQEKKAKTKEVAEGHECGIMSEAKIEIAVGDALEAVRTVEKLSS